MGRKWCKYLSGISCFRFGTWPFIEGLSQNGIEERREENDAV